MTEATTTSCPHLADPHATFDPATRLFFELVGTPMPARRQDWPAIIETVTEAAGPLAVARGLELAARQPSMAPADTPVMPPLSDGSPRRWWTGEDQQRAAALAEVYRKRAREVSE
jgi:hypothetical protein